VERPVTTHKRRRVPRTALLVGAVAVLAVGILVGFLVGQSSASYIVSSRAGHVVVLRGHVGSGDHAARGKVVRVYRDAPVSKFSAPVLRELRSGIVARSLSDARSIVDRLPRRLGANERATPSPPPTPTPSLGPKTPLPSPHIP